MKKKSGFCFSLIFRREWFNEKSGSISHYLLTSKISILIMYDQSVFLFDKNLGFVWMIEMLEKRKDRYKKKKPNFFVLPSMRFNKKSGTVLDQSGNGSQRSVW